MTKARKANAEAAARTARRRRDKYIGAGVAVAGFALAGAALGYAATLTPSVTVGGPSDRIEVWAAVEAPIRFYWSVNADNRVEMSISVSLELLEDLPEPRDVEPLGNVLDVSLVLFCDARIADSEGQFDIADDGGIEEDCARGGTMPAWQKITVGVDADCSVCGNLYRDLRTVGNWSATGAGIRVARSPQMVLGGLYEVNNTSIDWDLKEPVVGASTLTAMMDTGAGQYMQWYLPSESIDGKLRTDVETSSTGDSSAGSITWRGEVASDQLATSEARWSDARSGAVAQLQLLVAGLLLGIAASLLVEFALERLRERESAV